MATRKPEGKGTKRGEGEAGSWLRARDRKVEDKKLQLERKKGETTINKGLNVYLVVMCAKQALRVVRLM